MARKLIESLVKSGEKVIARCDPESPREEGVFSDGDSVVATGINPEDAPQRTFRFTHLDGSFNEAPAKAWEILIPNGHTIT